jgi:hypothetical protein
MRIFTVTTERSIGELRARVQLAEANQADRRAAHAALLAANPGLEDSAITAGMTIVVPSVPKAKREVGEPVKSATAALVEAGRAALAVLLDRARAAEQARVSELDALAAGVKVARTAARRRGEPLAKELEELGPGLKLELVRRGERRDALTAVAAEWTVGLDRLAERIERWP